MSDRTWNARQREAIDVRGKSVVVSAAAGSGKTSVLTERVLSLIADGSDIENMLIVTFTNLAAGEMKERIYRRLMQAGTEVPRLAAQAEKCAFADISTIHAFCGRVIRDNFAHAGVLPNVAIADAAQTALITQRAMDAAAAQLLSGGDGERFVSKFAPRGDLGGIKGIVHAITNRAVSQRDPDAWLAQAEAHFTSEAFPVALFDVYRQMAKDAAARAAVHLAERSNIWRARGFAAEADMSEMARIDMLRAVHGITIDNALLPEMMPITAPGARGAPNRESSTLTNRAAKCFDMLRDYERCFADKVAAELAATADDGRMFLALTRTFMTRYASAKRAKNLIDHDDTIHFALRALAVPDIAARYQRRYAHIFVDEYQDINDAQNAIMTCIQKDGNDFLVGDVKQCIYTFRESNPDLLIGRCRDLAGDGLIEMNTNYRSMPGVVDFINGVMHHMMTEDAGGVRYVGGHRLDAGLDGDGRVDIVMADMGGQDSVGAEGAAIGRYIRALIDDGYRYRDIAVLRPEISTSGKQIAKALEQMDIPVVTSAPDARTPLGHVFINLLALIARPVSDVTLISVMRYPHFGFTEPELAHIRIAQKNDDSDDSFYSAVYAFDEDSALGSKVASFIAEIDRYRHLSEALAVPDFLMRLRQEAAFRDYALTSPDGKRADSAIDALIAAVLASGAAGLVDVLEIAALGALGGEPSAAPGETDAVFLTTIHKSKGLEFPAVILSGMHKQINTRDAGGAVLIGRDLGLALDILDAPTHTRRPTLHKMAVAQQISREKISETVRLLYVGMTRAIRRLAVFGAGTQIKEKWQDEPQPGWQHDAATYFDLIMPAVHMMCRDNGQDIEECVEFMQAQTPGDGKKDKAQRLDELLALASASPPADIFVRYDYEKDLGVPSKLSVSALKRRSEVPLLHPAALPSVHDDISPAQRGTLMHKVLQKIGLRQKSAAEVKAFAEGMAQQGMIDDATHVDTDAIARFLGSSLAARARSSVRCLAEAPFCLGVRAEDVGVADSSEPVVVQGVVDMCFIEDGAWVIIDYKTDRIDAASADAAAQKYTVQLDLYAKALTAITGMPVKERNIYFLETGQAVSLH